MKVELASVGIILVAATTFLIPTVDEVQRSMEDASWNLATDLAWFFGPYNPDMAADGQGGAARPQKVPTDTSITQWPDRIEKGKPFLVEGEVIGRNGQPVAGARVEVYLNETKASPGFLAGEGRTDRNGHYAIDARVPRLLEASNYQLVTRHTGTLAVPFLYLESYSDPGVAVVSDTRVNAEVPKRDLVASPTVIRGSLVDADGVGVPAHAMILIVDDIPINRTETGPDGSYAFVHEFADPGIHSVRVAFEGTEWYRKSHADGKIEIIGEGFDLEPVVHVDRGKKWEISGRLLGGGGPAPNETVIMDLSDLPVTFNGAATKGLRFTTGPDGRFKAEVVVDGSARPGPHNVTYRANDVEKEQVAYVYVPTRLEVTGAPAGNASADGFNVTARLVDDEGTPLANETLYVTAGTASFNAITDTDGYARFDTGPLDEGDGSLAVAYTGSGWFKPVREVRDYHVPVTPVNPAWLWIIGALMLAFVAVSVLILVKRRKARSPLVLILRVPETPDGADHVFEAGESITILARAMRRAANGDGRDLVPMAGAELTVRVNGERRRLIADGNGEAETRVAFPADGDYRARLRYAGSRGIPRKEASVHIRVQPYRRAIEESYERLRHMAADTALPVHGGTTPRELERAIMAATPGLDPRDLDALLLMFEVADFSERDVDRNAWTAFVRGEQAAEDAIRHAARERPEEVAIRA